MSDWRSWFYRVWLLPGCPTGAVGSIGYGYYQVVRLVQLVLSGTVTGRPTAAAGSVGYGYQAVRLTAAGSMG